MYGKISSFRRDIGVGIIAAEDGRKYRFQRQNIVNPRLSLEDEDVDFELDGRAPKSIIVLAGSPWSVFSGALATPLFPTAVSAEAGRLAA